MVLCTKDHAGHIDSNIKMIFVFLNSPELPFNLFNVFTELELKSTSGSLYQLLWKYPFAGLVRIIFMTKA